MFNTIGLIQANVKHYRRDYYCCKDTALETCKNTMGSYNCV